MSKLSIIGIVIVIAAMAIFFSRRFRMPLMEGAVSTENRDVSGFTKLNLDGVFKTVITQDGGPAGVRVETNKSLQRMIEISNDGETLRIKSKSNFHFNTPSKMVVYINVKDLKSIESNCVGSLETQGTIKATDLELSNSSVGKTTMQLEVQDLTATLDAVGATILTGHAASANINNKSVGKLDAAGLKVDKLTISNDAVGAVEVYASQQISIDHNGVGKLIYHGPATVKSLKDNGVGKVSKAD